MAAVTQRTFLGLFAAAEKYIFRIRRLVFYRLKFCSFVAAIAIGLSTAMLAPAPGDFSGIGDINNDWAKFRATVGAVAERLLLGAATGAPSPFARRFIQNVGFFLR